MMPEVKLQEIADFIVHEYLSFRNLFSNLVSRLLTVNQNKQRIDHSEICLEQFWRNRTFRWAYNNGRQSGLPVHSQVKFAIN